LLEDEELWNRIVGGDARQFSGWYQMQAPRLKIFLRHLLGSEQVAEDVMQETFTQIWRRPVGYEAGRGSLRAWLYGAARRRAAEWRRKQKPEEAMESEPAQASGIERSSMLADAMARLSAEQRTLLWLREVEGHSYQELAEILDIPVSTVRSRLHAAREALRQLWLGNQKAKGEGYEVR